MHTTIRTITAAAVTAALAFGATPAIAQEAGNEVVVNVNNGVQNLIDSDGDGIPDEWETRGVILNDGTDIPLPDWGADPDRPDIFLQLNWMQPHNGKSFAPTPEILDDLVQLFDDNGINLFIDAGETYTNIPNYGEALGGATREYTEFFKASYPNSWGVGQVLATERNEMGDRKNIFHLGIIGDRMHPSDGFASGIAPIGLGSFFVANNSEMKTQEDLRNTILHEFGHNLGLQHNGATATVQDLKVATHDQAYRSVMNYKYQVGANAIFDYSHEGYTYNYNGIVREVPADWDSLKLADGTIGQEFKTYGPGQTKPVSLEGAKAQRKARIEDRNQAEAAQVAAAPAAKAQNVTVENVKVETIKAQTPSQAAGQAVVDSVAQAGGPNIAAIIGAIIAVLAVLGIGAGAAFMM